MTSSINELNERIVYVSVGHNAVFPKPLQSGVSFTDALYTLVTSEKVNEEATSHTAQDSKRKKREDRVNLILLR